mmetsp:Transcript_20975/g.50064  ORF Transcript_20975/g.50064 Transcript_20975/m.50064 type:complete len:204 (-) Transcript_20975:515-1126(-)
MLCEVLFLCLGPLLDELLRCQEQGCLPGVQSGEGIKLRDSRCECIRVSVLHRRREVLQQLALARGVEAHVDVLVALHRVRDVLLAPPREVADPRVEEVTLRAVLEQIAVHRLPRYVLEDLDRLVVVPFVRRNVGHFEAALVGLRRRVLAVKEVRGPRVRLEALVFVPLLLLQLGDALVLPGRHLQPAHLLVSLLRLDQAADGI